MRNIDFKRFQNIGLAIMTAVLIIVIALAFLTYKNSHIADDIPLLGLAVQYHFMIMMVLVVISITYGLFWSTLSSTTIEQKSKNTKSMLVVVLKFLGREERTIIDYLCKNGGKTTQNEIARLPKMNSVKAYRSIQKLQEKDIIEVNAHGKIRFVSLKADIKEALHDANQ